MSERTHRLFFALWPSDDLRREIWQATQEAVLLSQGRAIPAINFHVTLAFLGSIPESRLENLHKCAAETPVEPFDLFLGTLVGWKRQNLLCLEPTAGRDELVALVERLRASLEQHDFTVERRPFHPHLTLAREIRHLKPEQESIRTLRWPVRRVELVESTVTDQGSIYTILGA